MNKHKILYVWFLIVSLVLVSGCATPRNPEGTIDTCKLTKPPKESMVSNSSHLGRMYGYPDLKDVPDNYSGCQKTWLGSYNSSSSTFRLFSYIKFNDGLVSHIEFPSSNGGIATCEFDGNGNLSKNSSRECEKKDFYSIKDFKSRMKGN